MTCDRDCITCKHEKELIKPPQERDLNCQQCAYADRTMGVSHPNWESNMCSFPECDCDVGLLDYNKCKKWSNL